MTHSLRSHCAAHRLCIAALFFAAAAAQAQTPPLPRAASMPMGQMPHAAAGHTDMKQAMLADMEGLQKMSMSGDTDKDFAVMMKMHHQQALKMAGMQLEQGKSPEMKAMAKKIITAQKKEIAEFDRWLAKHK